ncbi:MAG: hypothetical protein IJ852_00555 [Alphaproteobacteria bacterium]|nr:hypothetical protein [Alphaproteobacteria bacterium]
MSIYNKIISFGLMLGLAALISTPVSAAENADQKAKEETSKAGAVLFRIENIRPVANDDGLTYKCDYLVTVYNRMEKEVKEANLNFNWVDNVSGKYVMQDGKLQTKEGKDAAQIVSTSVQIKNIPAHRQKSFEQSIETDKCFLLLDNLNYKVENCVTVGNQTAMKDSKIVGSGDCAGNFNYVDSKNPEYYSEFKDTPDDVIEDQIEQQRDQLMKKINAGYDKTVESLNATNETLQKIELGLDYKPDAAKEKADK